MSNIISFIIVCIVGYVFFSSCDSGPHYEEEKIAEQVKELPREEGKIDNGKRMTDEEFFKALNLDNVELANVKSAVGSGDLLTAKRAFVRHILSREGPKWFFDWRDKPTPKGRPNDPNVANADRYARNELVSVGIWHNFGVDIDWDANPTPNKYVEWTYQLNRHPYWKELGRAYWDTGDEKYAKAFVFQMNDWVRDNPVPLYNNARYPGSRWRTLEAGIRMSLSWFDSFFYFLSSPSFDDDSIIIIIKSFVEHARYLKEFASSGNWLLNEMRGLYHVGAMFPEFKEAETWRRIAIERLNKEIDFQVYPDGVHFELAPAYHKISMRHIVGALRVALLNNYSIPIDYLGKLERMYNYYLYATMPNGHLPGLNDSNYTDARGPLSEGVGFFPHRNDFLWLSTKGEKGTPPAQTSYAFPYAGQLVMRSGWDKDARYLLFDVGPFGWGHRHEDKLSFVIHAYGSNLLIDPGNYAYDSSKWRRYITSSYAHNVIHVDGLDQHRRGLSDREQYVAKIPRKHVWQSTKDFDYASAGFGEFPTEGFGPDRQKIAVQTRHILYVKNNDGEGQNVNRSDYWLVADVLKPNDDKQHTYEAMFHLDAMDATVDPETNRVLTLNGDKANLAIIPVGGPGLTVEIVKGQETPFVQGWLHDRGKGVFDLRPIPTAIFKRMGEGVTFFVYVFYPVPGDAALPVNSVIPISLSPDNISVRVIFDNGRIDELKIGQVPQINRTKK